MQIHQLRPPRGARKTKRIVGRGNGSGRGKTSGRGHKGQNARSGRSTVLCLEGGQSRLIRRLPKVGFRSKRPVVYQLIRLDCLNQFKGDQVVNAEALKKSRVIRRTNRPYKILGSGEIKKALKVQAHGFSKSAQEKIKKAGGKTEIIKLQTTKNTSQANSNNQNSSDQDKG